MKCNWNNDRAIFMLLFEKDFPNMAADRYAQNDQFFRKLFDDPDEADNGDCRFCIV